LSGPRPLTGHVMKRRTILAIGCVCVFSSGTSTVAKERAGVETRGVAGRGAKSSPQDADTIFRKVKSDLLGRTSVPLRLPSFLPDAGDAQNPLYANVQAANQASYSIELGWMENCNGGNACHYGTVRGSTARLIENGVTRVPVKLRGGIIGYFIHSTCGAHCDDSAIGWAEGSSNYSISIKAAGMRALVEVANSAIGVRNGQNP
jgi:hypothetical protein